MTFKLRSKCRIQDQLVKGWVSWAEWLAFIHSFIHSANCSSHWGHSRQQDKHGLCPHGSDHLTGRLKIKKISLTEWSQKEDKYRMILLICGILKNGTKGASLVAQQLRIRLSMQGTRVRALVWEDPTCRGATKPVRHSYWVCALEPTSHNYWSRAPRACAPQQEKPTCSNEDPMQPKIKINK